MSFADYFSHGQQIEIETAWAGHVKKCGAQIIEVSGTTMKIKLAAASGSLSAFVKESKAIVWGKKNEFKYSVHVTIDSVEDGCNVVLRHIPTRTHLRVDSFLVFSYKRIKDETYLAKRKQYTQQMRADSESYVFMPSRVMTEETEVQTNIPPEVIHEIHSIHRKLDFIIKLLGPSDEENIFKKEPEEVNISGSGMRFRTPEPLRAGEYVEVKLVLPIASGVIIELIGQVVRCISSPLEACSDVHRQHETAMTFVAINEDDREFIIRYVFKRQRELLRAEEGLGTA